MLDKIEDINIDNNTLLIVLDTPDIKRIDGINDIKEYKSIIKIDHHPIIDEYENMRYKFDKEFIVDDICFYTYVINHTKKEYYRRKSNRDRNNWFSPISFLMISGNGYYGGKYGYWLNDDVEASNNIDNLIKEGYTNKTPLYTYSYFIGCSEK